MTVLDTQYHILERQDLQHLFTVLTEKGYRVIAPTKRDSAIVYEELDSADELPIGWQDIQNNGTYRLEKSDDERVFGYTVSPQSWKRFLSPPEVRLWRARRVDNSFEVEEDTPDVPRYAFIGVRACELNAIQIQDRIFMGGEFVDPTYQARREGAFIVAVNCGRAGNTCFCVSMETGPKAEAGFDLAMTEVIEGEHHYFVLETGSEKGMDVLMALPHRSAQDTEIYTAKRIIAATRSSMGRTIETDGLKDLLYENTEHANWDSIADRCLSCANCTMVCPTCFCMTVEDVTDLAGETAERVRKWDSCFTNDFSYIHGGSVRTSNKARYRQWMTHKFATWVDQFDSMGCVGCGRCIAWCPVGIDITEEARIIRESDMRLAKGQSDDSNNT